MASRSKGKSSKTVTERSGANWSAASLESSNPTFSIVKEAASAPIAELKKAALVALLILQTIQVWARKNNVRENKEAYERLGDDSSGLIAAIWRSFKKAENPEEWLSAEMREILEDLTHTLENICSFVQEQLSRNKAIRVIFSRADGVKINEYREHLNYAMQKFELQSHMNINDVLMRVVKKNDQISEQILHRNEEEEVNHALAIMARDARDREIAEKLHEEEIEKLREISRLERLKQVEMDREAEDERLHSEELNEIEKETRDRKTELERLRAAASAVEKANRLKKAEEEEIAHLKRTLAAEEERRSNRTRKKKSSREEDDDDEEDWEGSVMVEEATSEEEEDQPVRRSSKVKKNRSGSSKRRPVALEDSTEDDEEDWQRTESSRMRTARRKLSSASLHEEDLHSMRSSKIRMARRNLSSASLRAQETQDDYTDEEDDYAPSPPRKGPKVKHKPQTSLGNLPHDVDNLMAQFQGFTPMGLANPHWNGSGSPMYIPGMHSNPYIPTYGAHFSPPMGPYGPGVGVPGTIVNSGVGNITNTTIANVGNNNSVKKVYRPRSQRRGT